MLLQTFNLHKKKNRIDDSRSVRVTNPHFSTTPEQKLFSIIMESVWVYMYRMTQRGVSKKKKKRSSLVHHVETMWLSHDTSFINKTYGSLVAIFFLPTVTKVTEEKKLKRRGQRTLQQNKQHTTLVPLSSRFSSLNVTS